MPSKCLLLFIDSTKRKKKQFERTNCSNSNRCLLLLFAKDNLNDDIIEFFFVIFFFRFLRNSSFGIFLLIRKRNSKKSAWFYQLDWAKINTQFKIEKKAQKEKNSTEFWNSLISSGHWSNNDLIHILTVISSLNFKQLLLSLHVN